eukprot:CAMPEP_0113934428 /NCGR_PEP_ID=MMETSP1339-20121228/1755_1 /TAXON_ID=94617 /ORGANISM="Fibrocapsa japonica" /LENGTH=87 /DNA_ID=CAMNT_0000936227 /DNA_START=17 /DNA_END=280 /DNA_ORIENTATION=- /assembly_acc=CAM_ASM_000762
MTRDEQHERAQHVREVTGAPGSDGEDSSFRPDPDRERLSTSTHSIDGDAESVITEPLESEGSNIAVKGTESSEGEDVGGRMDSDDDL